MHSGNHLTLPQKLISTVFHISALEEVQTICGKVNEYSFFNGWFAKASQQYVGQYFFQAFQLPKLWFSRISQIGSIFFKSKGSFQQIIWSCILQKNVQLLNLNWGVLFSLRSGKKKQLLKLKDNFEQKSSRGKKNV